MEITIVGPGEIDVPEDVAADLKDTYDKLGELPAKSKAISDFETKEEADTFVKQAKKWAEDNGVKFLRKDPAEDKTIKQMPRRVAFRLYKPRDVETVEE